MSEQGTPVENLGSTRGPAWHPLMMFILVCLLGGAIGFFIQPPVYRAVALFGSGCAWGVSGDLEGVINHTLRRGHSERGEESGPEWRAAPLLPFDADPCEYLGMTLG